MGKIKSKSIKLTARRLLEKDIEFSVDFDENKKILDKTMPSKKIRNQLAGYLVRLKKYDRKKQEMLSQDTKK